MLRIVQVATMLSLYAFARRHEVYFGLKYAAAMTALWFMIEIAARMNPGSFNNPMMESGDANGIDQLEPARIGEVVGPICAAAGVAVALLGVAMTAVLVGAPSMQKDAAILIVPTGPMMIGIPLYIMLGKLAELAKSAR
ncbi:hypothetical protein [Gemmatimonas sp.]